MNKHNGIIEITDENLVIGTDSDKVSVSSLEQQKSSSGKILKLATFSFKFSKKSKAKQKINTKENDKNNSSNFIIKRAYRFKSIIKKKHRRVLRRMRSSRRSSQISDCPMWYCVIFIIKLKFAWNSSKAIKLFEEWKYD